VKTALPSIAWKDSKFTGNRLNEEASERVLTTNLFATSVLLEA
jgi:hypothetical protein